MRPYRGFAAHGQPPRAKHRAQSLAEGEGQQLFKSLGSWLGSNSVAKNEALG